MGQKSNEFISYCHSANVCACACGLVKNIDKHDLPKLKPHNGGFKQSKQHQQNSIDKKNEEEQRSWDLWYCFAISFILRLPD